MAQTKRKRRPTKHRGNAAGMVEARGRTGRKPTDAERKDPKAAAKQARLDRMNRPPTWQAATNRAGIAAVIFGILMYLIFDQKIATAVAYTAFVFVLYIPLGYYTDTFIYRRRQRTAAAKGKP